MIEGERGQEGRSKARRREREERERERESGPALTAHSSHRWLAGWLAHC